MIPTITQCQSVSKPVRVERIALSRRRHGFKSRRGHLSIPSRPATLSPSNRVGNAAWVSLPTKRKTLFPVEIRRWHFERACPSYTRTALRRGWGLNSVRKADVASRMLGGFIFIQVSEFLLALGKVGVSRDRYPCGRRVTRSPFLNPPQNKERENHKR